MAKQKMSDEEYEEVKRGYEDEALVAIKANNIFYIVDIIPYLSYSRTTFYDYKLDKSDSIKELLVDNLIKTKQRMRSKWYKSDNATLQVALMKLLGTDEECHRLNGSKTENMHTGADGGPVKYTVEFVGKDEKDE